MAAQFQVSRFYACGVSMGYARLTSLRASPFKFLVSMASPFNFVEGFAVQVSGFKL